MSRKLIKGLNAYEYQHPFDRNALVLLSRTKGLSVVIKKISEFGVETYIRLQLTGNGIRITPTNLGVIHDLLVEACQILGIDSVPELYLVRGDEFSTTIGVEKPLIALSNSMIDNFSEEELLFIIGHQLSYIKSESVLYQQLATGLNLIASLGPSSPISLFTMPVKLAIKRWEKMARFTADRAGLLCCQNTDAAASALIKLAGFPQKFYHKIDVEEFRQQAYEFDEFDYNQYNKIVKLLMTINESHPPSVVRGAQFFKWIKSGDYENILNRKPIINKNLKTKCSFCGQPTLGNEMFCTNCGNKVGIEKIKCLGCSSEINEDDKFCMTCGAKVEELNDESDYV